MKADQAIFTSLARRGMSGYHLVSRSTGINEMEARELATWAPSHGALLLDDANQISVNFQILTTGRYALSRTCQGPPEYSGRGGRQLYTHILVFDLNVFKAVHYRIFALYRDAMALGRLHYQPNPDPTLPPVEFSWLHRFPPPDYYEQIGGEIGLPLRGLAYEIQVGRTLQYPYAGDRTLLAECLLGVLDARTLSSISFSTSLKPSSVRPYRLCLVGE